MPAASDDPDKKVAQDEPAEPPLEYEQYFRQHRPRLLIYARHIADNVQQGEDAVQEAMIDAYAQWSEVSVMDNPWGWVITVINRKLYRLRQRRRREGSLLVDNRLVMDCSASLAEQSELGDVIRRLPPRQREIVALRFALELEIDEIAKTLDLKESTVRSTLTRATQRLKALLATAQKDD